MMINKRQLLQIGAASLISAGLVENAFAQPVRVENFPGQINLEDELKADFFGGKEPEVRRLSLYNLHTGDQAKDIVYKEKGLVVSDALSEINYVLRDFRTGDVTQMDVALMDLLDSLSRKLEVSVPYNVISGYRSPKTNAMLAERSGGVAKNSMHMQGKAIDIRVPGIELSHLRNVAKELKIGGVGYYAASDFVHVDTGRVRYW